MAPSFAAVGAAYTGTVVRVIDGDSLMVRVDSHQRQVRLKDIDAPEYDQPFGLRAKRYTASLCLGIEVTVHLHGTDDYERDLGVVLVEGQNINRELLWAGLAWHYKFHNKDPDLAALEDAARQAVGLATALKSSLA